MIASLLSLDRVAVIAHRGGAKLRPENTIAAFDHAVALGAHALECDVHFSRDRDVVVIHDATLDRTTNESGPVRARTAHELARVDAGFHFGAAAGYPFRGQGMGVPRLRDLVDRYRDRVLVIEIKGDDPEVAEGTVDILREARAADRVILAGFNQTVLDTARRLAPELVTSASFDEAKPAASQPEGWTKPRAARFRLFQVPFRLNGRQQFDRAFVQAARRAGLPVQVWIVDEPDEMGRLIDWGVTGLISDRPDVALDVVNALT